MRLWQAGETLVEMAPEGAGWFRAEVELPEEPGRNTVEAIRFGVDRGAVGLVRELVAASLRSCGIVSCLAAGGDAGFFAAALPELKAVESDFTLHGIRLAWERRRDRQA